MKKILIFSLNYYPRFVGGAEVAIREITNRIPQSEIEFHMITLWHDRSLPKIHKVGNVLVHRIGFATNNPDISDLKRYPLVLNRYLFQLYACWHALLLHKRHSYDGIWAVMAHSAGIPAGLFKRFVPSVPYTLSLQEGDPLPLIERMMVPVWPLFKNAFTAADRVQAISTFLGAWASRMGYAGEVAVVPNGVDHARFSAPVPREVRIKERRALQIQEQDTVLVTASRLVHKNGVDTVIEALSLLPKHVCFVIYGNGPDETKLKALAERIGVAERVRFVGKVSHADLPVKLSVGDIFIRASRSEGMGNAFIEAFAKGLPVIGTREGGITDFLYDGTEDATHEKTGWVVKKDEPATIQRAVEDIMARPGTVKAVVERAQKLAQHHYDWETIVLSFKKERLFDPIKVS